MHTLILSSILITNWFFACIWKATNQTKLHYARKSWISITCSLFFSSGLYTSSLITYRWLFIMKNRIRLKKVNKHSAFSLSYSICVLAFYLHLKYFLYFCPFQNIMSSTAFWMAQEHNDVEAWGHNFFKSMIFAKY